MIKPTVGRVVWFWPNRYQGVHSIDDKQPIAATIAFVLSDRCVNISIVDHIGNQHRLKNVTLLQGDENYRPPGAYCEWMPYQVGQAKAQAIETKTYPDGATATGAAPLPDQPPIDLGQVTGTAPDARPKSLAEMFPPEKKAPGQQPSDLVADSIEAEIQAKGLTAPRVTKARIDELMSRIVYTCDQRPNGSTTTLVHAFLDGDFYLATGVSACVSVANFDASIGRNIATANAESAAQDKLWELEGYALRDRLAQGGAA